MKALRLLVALFAMIFGSSYAQALDPPAHTGWVVDNAHLFSPADRRALARELSAIQKAGGGRGVGPQVEVLTITSLQGDDVKDFAIRTARTWKLGAKGYGSDGRSNGVLILIVANKKNPSENRIRIEVGNGLEGDLLDGYVGTLARAFSLAVAAKTPPYLALSGVIKGLAAKMSLKKEASPATSESPRASESDAKAVLFVVGILFAGILGAIFHRRRRFLRYWFGGVLGGSSWGAVAFSFAMADLIIVTLAAVGYVLGYLLSALLRHGADGLGFWHLPGPGPGGGSGAGDHAGAGGDFSGGGADTGALDGLGEALSGAGDALGSAAGGCDAGGCDVGGCG